MEDFSLIELDLSSSCTVCCEVNIGDYSLHDFVAAVETSDGHSCHGSGKLALPVPSGFLLGPVRSTGLGSSPANCVHVVSSAKGQRINLTLYDFGTCTTPVRLRSITIR